MSTQPEDDPSQFDARTVELPDGTRVTVVHKPGALDGISDEDLIAKAGRVFDDEP